MTMKNNNPAAIQEAFQKEFAETNKWTRAWVEERVCGAVRFATKLKPRDPKKLKLVKSIPAACSVRYEWLESVIAAAGATFPENLHIPKNYYGELYDFVVDWLDSVDSTLDRRIIIMRACLLSMNEIGARIGISRQRGSRRHARAIDKLVWYLNHSEKYKKQPAQGGK